MQALYVEAELVVDSNPVIKEGIHFFVISFQLQISIKSCPTHNITFKAELVQLQLFIY
jgi:hypothetical protein